MTRLSLPFGRRVLVLIVLLATLVLLFPLRIAIGLLDLPAQGVAARNVSGTVWGGRVEELVVSGLGFGSVDAELSPLALLTGEARLSLRRSPGAEAQGPVSGAVTVSRNTLGIADLSAAIPLGAALAPLPVGTVTASGLDVRFADGACERASGTLRAAVTGSFGGVALAQGLTGAASCDGRYVRFLLNGQSGQERLDLRLAVTGDYTADLTALEPAADRVALLAAQGFEAVPGGYRLRVTGRL